MASKSEQRERLRQERLAAERRAAGAGRGRMILGYVVAGALSLAVVVGLVIVLSGGGSGGGAGAEGNEDFPDEAFIAQDTGFINDVEADGREGTPPPSLETGDLEEAARVANCELDLELEDEGNTHVQEPPDYETMPATSGDHSQQQQADGAYSEPVPAFNYVHAMEHGRITIQYSPDLPEEDQLALKGVFDEDPAGVLIFPNPELEDDVAVTSWTRMMTCPTYEGGATLDAVRDYRDELRGIYNPENVPLAF